MAETKQIHFTGSIISRNKGQSAVEHSAYRSGEKLELDREGETFDYTHKKGVLYSEIMLADHAPPEWNERQILWNAVENFETKCNAQLARSLEFSLPCELSEKENIALCEEVGEYYRKQGMCVDFSIHDAHKKNNNIHCHMMLTVRPLNPDGTFVKNKSHRVYILDENGQKIPLKNGKDYKTKKVNVVDWDDKGNMEKWRSNYAAIMEKHLKNHGIDVKVEHRSYEKQGVNRIPTIHMGSAVAAMERKGVRTRVGDMNREIKLVNEILERGDKSETVLEAKMDKLEKLLNRQKAKEKENELKADTVEGMLLEYQNNRSRFIQEAGIHQRSSTKAENLKDFSEMYAFLNNHGIRSMEDLQNAVKEEKHKRREIIHDQNDISRRQKDMVSLINAGENYRPLRKYHKKLDELEGRKREQYMNLRYDKLRLADTWLSAIQYYTGKELFQPSKWEAESKQLVIDMRESKRKLQETDENIEMLSDIIDMVSAVDNSRQIERRKEMQKNMQDTYSKENIEPVRKKRSEPSL